MDGSVPAGGSQEGWLQGRLTERLADLDHLIAEERARPAPDEARIRRLSRERLLARDRMAALAGCAMPRWARPDAPVAE